MVVPEKALFQFDDFFILNYHCNFIDPGPQKDLKIKGITDQYLIELDFGFTTKEVEKKLLLFCKVSVNQREKKLPGYSIFAEGVGICHLELGQGLTRDRYAKEIQYPAVSHGINNLRSYILMATSQGPFGKYQLPLINLGHLIKAKMGEISASQEEPKK